VKRADKVASSPEKPLMVYDGECNFCKFWITRWQQSTEGRVDYIDSQNPKVAEQLPEIPREQFDTAVQLIETDGSVHSGAEAVFRSLTYSRSWKWSYWLYQHVPGFSLLTEWLYHIVARNRTAASVLTRLLWGPEGALPSFAFSRALFLRLMGIIYLSAFVSLVIQILGLVGSHGILPADRMMEALTQQARQGNVGWERYHLVPTLCWISASDGFLQGLCWAGAALSIVLIIGLAPAPCLFLLWLIYLSLSVVSQEFLGFQWDVLLLETGFLAIFLAPLQLRLTMRNVPPPSRIARWLLWWLLFRLMFESGVVKLASGDPMWRSLTALTVHYETQPLPTWIGWYAHQAPAGFQKLSTVLMFFIELVVPFFIFAPRRIRFFACWSFVALQTFILLTGNYCFFNYLTIALALLLLDDAALRRLVPARFRKKRLAEDAVRSRETEDSARDKTLPEITVPLAPVPKPGAGKRSWSNWILVPVAAVVLFVSVPQVLNMLVGRAWPANRLVLAVSEWVSPFRTINSYGLFMVMTNPRFEIIVQGSDDGQTWKDYEFKYKPGDPKRRPEFVAPHQPRLDWQMWFAAVGTYRENPWFVNFCIRLLQGEPEVLKLLDKNPFPDKPPKRIRAVLYEYHFTNFKERRETGNWWKREYKGEYLPEVSLQ
jgi:lipase maturation factor 1